MLLAEQKYHENIAEYVLLMYQTEDLLRSFSFDVNHLCEALIAPNKLYSLQLEAYQKWYADIARQMKSERIEEKGHLSSIREVLVELSFLHNTLLQTANDEKYKDLYERAIPHIEEFKDKSNLKDKNEIEVAFHALYMKLLLRLKGQEISAATEEALDSMRILLAYLSRAFHQMKRGELQFWQN